MYKETTATKRIVALDKKIRAVCGGTSASKTISILLYLIARAQTDEEPTLTSVVSESLPHLKRGALRDFKNIMKSHHYWNENSWRATDYEYEFETGSKIEFFGVDSPDKLRGGRRDRLFINEANNVSLDAFDQLEVRTKEFVFLDWNPSNEFWFYTEIQNSRNDVEFITLTYKDNEALSPEIVSAIEARKGNKAWWQVYGLGQLGEVEDIIYKGWQIIDEVPHEARLECYGLDFGYRPDMTALVAIYSYNGGYVIDELNVQLEWKLRDMATYIQNLEDAVVVSDTNEPRSVTEMREYGIRIVETEKGKDSKKHGIKMMQDQQISVTKRSTETIKGFRNWLWKRDKQGNLVPGETEHEPDPLAAARYAIQYLKPYRTTDVFAQMRVMQNRAGRKPLR